MGPLRDFNIGVVDKRFPPDGKGNHHSIIGRLGGKLVKKRLVVRRSFVVETVTVAEDEAVQENQTFDAPRNRFSDFGNYGAAEAVSHEHEIREILIDDVIDNRFGAVRVVYTLVDTFTVARDGRGESSVAFLGQLENRRIPGRAVMPGTVHQYERFQSWFS